MGRPGFYPPDPAPTTEEEVSDATLTTGTYDFREDEDDDTWTWEFYDTNVTFVLKVGRWVLLLGRHGPR